MWSLCLAGSLLSVVSATDIIAYRSNNCQVFPGLPLVHRCNNILPFSCCEFPDNFVGRIMSVYAGTFPLPGGVGNWHNEGVTSQCGRVMDSDGNSNSVCLTDIGQSSYPGYGGGGSWLTLPLGDPKKSRTGSLIPAFKAPPGFANIRPAGSGYRYKKRDEEGAMSIEEWQVSD